jgi:hypothetical protein
MEAKMNGTIIMIIVIVIVVFLATRWFWTWYFKINALLKAEEAILIELTTIRKHIIGNISYTETKNGKANSPIEEGRWICPICHKENLKNRETCWNCELEGKKTNKI